jgi:hypothetical protein
MYKTNFGHEKILEVKWRILFHCKWYASIVLVLKLEVSRCMYAFLVHYIFKLTYTLIKFE